jgi:hypothetical protein
MGHAFMVCIHTENQNQGDFYSFILHEISVLVESPLGHLRYLLTDVPPRPNSPLDNVNNVGHKIYCRRKKSVDCIKMDRGRGVMFILLERLDALYYY